MLRKIYEVRGVSCGSCEVCVLGNASLSRALAKYFPDWKPGTVTQIRLHGSIGQTSLAIDCSYSPTKRICSKSILARGEEEGLIMARAISLLDELTEKRKAGRETDTGGRRLDERSTLGRSSNRRGR